MFRRYERGSTRRYVLVATSAGLAVIASLLLAGAVGAGSDWSSAAGVSAKPISTSASGPTVVVVSSLPKVSAGTRSRTRPKQRLPFLSPLGKAGLAQARKNAAANAPTVEGPILPAPRAPKTPGPALTGFDGMADSTSICAPSGCEPSDQGIASNGTLVIQTVNSSVDVFDAATHTEQAGFPKSLQDFFNVPNLTNCNANNGEPPFLSDPRVLYDPADHRFIAATLEVEGAWGISPGCDPTSLYWVAVSQTDDPTGAWNVYTVDTKMDVGLGEGEADYTQLGFNGEGIFIGGNLFDQSASFFLGSFVLGLPKKDMENDNAIGTPTGFGGFVANNQLLDTVHPVASYGAGDGGPPGEFLVSSFNFNLYTGGSANRIVLFDFSNVLEALNTGICDSGHQCLSGVVVKTAKYSIPPLAGDGDGCTQCLETIDNRISATPVYMHGNIYFTHDTAAKVKTNVGTFVNANVAWGVIHPALDQTAVFGCTACSVITTKTKTVDQGTITFPGQTDTWFGAIQPDREGNLFIGFDYQSSFPDLTEPSSAYVARRATAAPGSNFPGNAQILRVGDNYYDSLNMRWGDYSAMGFDGWDSNGIWFATQYANSSNDWSTHIDELGYGSLDQK
jgi:hypothetical protein